jgi:predicted dehydrogenase
MPISRRRFLRGASASVAGAAASSCFPYILTSKALGAPGVPPASERIVLGTIGMGGQMNGLFTSALGSGRSPVMAVCDVYASKREKAKAKAEEKYKGVSAYNDFREVLARPDIDAVIIATPDHWHAPIVVAAAQAGKDIYCEKPLSLTIREARAMSDAVHSHDRILQVGSMQRSMGNFRSAVEAVRNGRLGKVSLIHVGLPHQGRQSDERLLPAQPIPQGFDYEMWLGPAPWRPYNLDHVSGATLGGWRMCRDFSGGKFTDWGAHHFDIVQWALNHDTSGPTRIVPTPGQNISQLKYFYGEGADEIEVRCFLPPGMPSGDGVLFEGSEGKLFVSRDKLLSWPESLVKTPVGSDDVVVPRSSNHIGNWLDCIKSRRAPAAPVEAGARSVTVCHLGNIAQWLGRELKWDAAREEFVRDEEAARWLDRPRRAPWHI